jgi:multiple sugar transport system substrate-binding protein
MTRENEHEGVSRREFLKAAGAVAAGIGANIIIPSRSRAAKKTLRILQWSHFVQGHNKWFNGTYVKEWGVKHDTEVIVDNIGAAGLSARAAAEVSAQKGHDLFMFILPPPVFEDQVIDHREIYEECERKYGKAIPLAIRNTYNPKTKKYYGFSDSYAPDPINYRKDLWDDIGMSPDTWDDIRKGGAKIKQTHGKPVGIGLSAETDTGIAMRTIMYSFGASVQDEKGNLVLNSRQTLEAVKYVKALFKETMTQEVLAWDESSNNRFMLAGKGSLALNSISVTRTGEAEKIPVTDHIWLAKAPKGAVARIGLAHLTQVYVIWKFAENIAGAKQFLVDYIGNSRQGCLASEFYNFPCFPKTVPDLKALLANDSKARPPDKYKVLEDVLDWTTNVGHPGYANAATDEVFKTWVLNTMFAEAATGAQTPEEAIKRAEKKCQGIWKKWREKGKI